MKIAQTNSHPSVRNERGYNRHAQVDQPSEFEASTDHKAMPERKRSKDHQLERAHFGRGKDVLD